MKKAVLYLRAYGKIKSISEQKIQLKHIAKDKKWQIIGCFIDNTKSGYFLKEVQKQYYELINSNLKLPYNLIMIYDFNYIVGDANDVVDTLNILDLCGIDLYFYSQNFNTSSLIGKVMNEICYILSDFRKDKLNKIKKGILNARNNGTVLGRPFKVVNVKNITNDRLSGMTLRKLSMKYKISLGKIHKIIKENIM